MAVANLSHTDNVGGHLASARVDRDPLTGIKVNAFNSWELGIL